MIKIMFHVWYETIRSEFLGSKTLTHFGGGAPVKNRNYHMKRNPVANS